MNKLLLRTIIFIVIITIVCIILVMPQRTQYTKTDLILVKNYIMEKIIFDEEKLKYYDINKDNEVTSSDYVLIKNQIKEEI